MKLQNKRKRRNEIALRSVLILMTVSFLLSIFTSCGGLPASPNTKEETTTSFVEKETDPPATTTVRYVASRESNKYHRTRCRYVDSILPENLVYYSTEDAALRAGKSPCSVCNP